MRIFLAVTLDRKTKEELAEIQDELRRKIKGIRWINPELLHITLKFLGETEEALVSKMENSFKELAEKTAPFHISLAGLGAFPSTKEPRVIWIGIKEGASELFCLSKGIEGILKDLHPSFYNINKDFRKSARNQFQPHLTIGRRNKNETFEADPFLFDESWEIKSRLYIESFYLIKSILRPTGPLYMPLQEFLLKKL